MGFRGGVRVLLCNSPNREPIGTSVVVQRVHVARVEVQVATVVRVVRNRRPIVTVVADVVERTIIVVA